MRHVLIMAGGSGKRLWPLSRQDMPKQLLRILGGQSLLRLAYERLEGVVDPSRVWVCTGADYAHVVAAELPELDPANILGEPEGRDSMNAIAWTAAVLAERDPEAVMAVVASDHIMRPTAAFQEALAQGFEVAENDPHALVTFGVVPSTAHTGYGYLHQGEALPDRPDVRRVLAFKEKPDRPTAESYLESGDYWWNSGMFVWRASTVLDILRQLLPDTHRLVTELAARPERLAEIYPMLAKISVDYAVMEPVSQGRTDAHVVAVQLPIIWHDVGGYPSLRRQLPWDEHGNAVTGTAVVVGSRDNLVLNECADGRLLAVFGMTDTVMVQTDKITVVAPLGESERIKELVVEVTARLGQSYA
ncbi:mannose-1-phosphate guanylyltransferase [Microlunatus aurantiacus]|uniref:Mannose-1-phosphate guanylyltransferase n=1 Tax=Microlunatus aurantiacus TaxID=446786 RepID=A0ABP7CLN0_9ACTN